MLANFTHFCRGRSTAIFRFCTIVNWEGGERTELHKFNLVPIYTELNQKDTEQLQNSLGCFPKPKIQKEAEYCGWCTFLISTVFPPCSRNCLNATQSHSVTSRINLVTYKLKHFILLLLSAAQVSILITMLINQIKALGEHKICYFQGCYLQPPLQKAISGHILKGEMEESMLCGKLNVGKINSVSLSSIFLEGITPSPNFRVVDSFNETNLQDNPFHLPIYANYK